MPGIDCDLNFGTLAEECHARKSISIFNAGEDRLPVRFRIKQVNYILTWNQWDQTNIITRIKATRCETLRTDTTNKSKKT